MRPRRHCREEERQEPPRPQRNDKPLDLPAETEWLFRCPPPIQTMKTKEFRRFNRTALAVTLGNCMGATGDSDHAAVPTLAVENSNESEEEQQP